MKLRNVAGGMSMIVNDDPKSNNGKVVKCLHFIGEIPEFIGLDHWCVDTMLDAVFSDDEKDDPQPYCRDSSMVPLNHDIAEEDLEVYHQEPVEA